MTPTTHAALDAAQAVIARLIVWIEREAELTGRATPGKLLQDARAALRV